MQEVKVTSAIEKGREARDPGTDAHGLAAQACAVPLEEKLGAVSALLFLGPSDNIVSLRTGNASRAKAPGRPSRSRKIREVTTRSRAQ